MYKEVDTMLIAELDQLCEFGSDLSLILQADEDVCINEKFTVGHITKVRKCGRIYWYDCGGSKPNRSLSSGNPTGRGNGFAEVRTIA